jgi:hypothetical protein
MISGTGRSGTNITKAIFAKHSKVATLPFEYRIIIDPGGIIDFYHSFTKSWSPFAADKKIRELEQFLLSKAVKDEALFAEGQKIKAIESSGRKITPPSYHGWELEKWIPGYTIHIKNLISQLTAFTFEGRWPGSESFSENNKMYFSGHYDPEKLRTLLGEFINNLTSGILQKQEKEVYAEDNTWNILFAGSLLEMLPNARLIHIIRDPRDVVASFVKQNWAPDNLDQAIAFYLSIINRWFEVEAKLDPKQFLLIKLEDLSTSPEAEIRKMCAFSQIDFETSMLEVDLSASNAGRWQKEFSGAEIEKLERSLQGASERLGYSS